MPQLKQLPDGSMGLEGSAAGQGEFVPASFHWSPTSTDAPFFTATRPLVVQAITATVEVAGTDAGAVTAVIRKAPSGTALASGTALHSGSINLKGTAATNQALTLSTTSGVVNLAAGDRLAFDLTGVMTSAVGSVTVHMTVA